VPWVSLPVRCVEANNVLSDNRGLKAEVAEAELMLTQVAELLGLSRARVEAIAARGVPADPGSESRGLEAGKASGSSKPDGTVEALVSRPAVGGLQPGPVDRLL
jgi:hypothetical protein